MIVDDSAVVRGLLARALESDGGIHVAASAANGQMALDTLKRHDIELLLLDVEMPVMDGLTALPLLVKARPDLKVIMVSSLTKSCAAVTLKALAAGAADYVAKPSSADREAGDVFRRDLVAKVKALAEARRAAASPSLTTRAPAVVGASLRAGPAGPPRAIAIGASTGGPTALYRIAAALKAELVQPIFVTQHMPPTFTAIFADHLARASGWAAAEACDGEAVAERRIYVAPGDYHMLVESADGGKRIRLSKGPAENYCRPAVDPMLRSLAAVYGDGLLAVMLTGMGHDGLAGADAVVAAGGAVIAQDQASSVVWGMPGAVATAGLCSALLPLDEIAPFLAAAARRGLR
ncbi:MAG TPA: chemotaxis-specific protein-glutamate methyltransferase CheB [Stellaceae bacterium]|nr:chemotaxis-specific protein-glutamate methyltransferase CheB [Stellaceae bacterium]